MVMPLPPIAAGGMTVIIHRSARSVTGTEQKYVFDATSVSDTEMACDILQK